MADEPSEGDKAATIAATRGDADTTIAAFRHNRINLLWEYTQAFLAVSLVAACIYCSVRGQTAVGPEGTVIVVPETLKAATFVVIGFYFGRTNHARPTGRPDDA